MKMISHLYSSHKNHEEVQLDRQFIMWVSEIYCIKDESPIFHSLNPVHVPTRSVLTILNTRIAIAQGKLGIPVSASPSGPMNDQLTYQNHCVSCQPAHHTPSA